MFIVGRVPTPEGTPASDDSLIPLAVVATSAHARSLKAFFDKINPHDAFAIAPVPLKNTDDDDDDGQEADGDDDQVITIKDATTDDDGGYWIPPGLQDIRKGPHRYDVVVDASGRVILSADSAMVARVYLSHWQDSHDSLLIVRDNFKYEHLRGARS